jgi:hypothetical protein
LFVELFWNIKQFNPAKTRAKGVRNCARKDGTNEDGRKKVRDTSFGGEEKHRFDKRFLDCAPSHLIRGIAWK